MTSIFDQRGVGITTEQSLACPMITLWLLTLRGKLQKKKTGIQNSSFPFPMVGLKKTAVEKLKKSALAQTFGRIVP